MAIAATSDIAVKHRAYTTDKWLVGSACTLIILGLLMVSSASMVVSEHTYNTAFHFLWRQVAFLGVGLLLSFFIIKIPVMALGRVSPILLTFGMILLVLVLIPGVGRQINGSARWIGFAGFSFQVSEIVKLFFLLYLAGYLTRHQQSVQTHFVGFVKPLVVLAIFGVLLLLEPDFGSVVVLTATTLGVLFLAGVRLRYFAVMVGIVIIAFAGLAVLSPYRLQRLTTFLNPWQHQFSSGYQLTQSLIAFGRGGIWGVGLGNSLQKLFYLPEAHTDFLFAVLAEELGLVGVLAVLVLFGILVYRGLSIAKRAFAEDRPYHAYLAASLALWIGLQAMINMGVNAGLLPTKGLTLPLMSYGGSSLLVMCCVIALLIRIDYELKAG